ncbi:hypothetical protein Syun_021004 [Stephania yunnanensis]|uniref:DUF7906 domain-containing protein n=1 Tax=Stephania yunnanensis TaxID=152371 RepID=A0AAP0IF98_9MAGN
MFGISKLALRISAAVREIDQPSERFYCCCYKTLLLHNSLEFDLLSFNPDMASSPPTTTPLLLLLILFLSATIAASSTPPILGLDSFLTQQFRLDPQASNDSFLSLSSSIKKSLRRHHSPPHPNLLLSSLQLSIPLHIKLVGPTFSSAAPSLLSSLISATHFSDHFHYTNHHHHPLPITHSPQLHIAHHHSLHPQISSALKSQISTTPSSLRSSFLSIPFSTVDQIVKDDFLKGNSAHLGGEVYIYLINLGPQSHPYAYSYGGDGGGDSSSPSFTRCLGSVWTGKERYIWIDLAAGPVNYGPALSGDGVLPRGEFHPLAAVHGPPKSEKVVLADLASLIWSAYQVLLVPSLRIPVTLEKALVVQFIHVHGSEEKDLRGLNWDNIERTFMDEAHDGGLLLKDQTLRFRTYHVNYNVCPVCSFAISRATNSYTSRFFFQNYTLIVSEYLDSKRLHQTLQESDDELKRAAGILDQEEDFGRVIPVYVFDLDYNRHLMLDRYHQSVAFKDMVIAVRTRSSQTVSDYNCNGRHVITQTRELERPIVGSILQSMWGVSPTHLVWSSRHNSTMVDYTWSVGQTPFGPFSETSSLSFVQRDAARRNVLLTTLNYTITSAIEVLESISAHGGDRHLLKQGQHVVFVERWNLLKYKLDKAVSALSHSDFEMASYFIRSSDHDLFVIHALIYQASQELEATFTCFKDPPFPWASVAMLSFGFVAFFYVYARRDRIFRSKRKQF